jgi:hypothetical protein
MAQQAADAVMRAYRVAGFTWVFFAMKPGRCQLKVEVLMSKFDELGTIFGAWFNTMIILSWLEIGVSEYP